MGRLIGTRDDWSKEFTGWEAIAAMAKGRTRTVVTLERNTEDGMDVYGYQAHLWKEHESRGPALGRASRTIRLVEMGES